MKVNLLVLCLIATATSFATIGCGKKHTPNDPNNIVPGSDGTHDGSSGPIYSIQPADCGPCPTSTSPATVSGCSATVGTAQSCEGTCFVATTVMPTYVNNPPTSGPEYDYYDENFYDPNALLPRGEYVRNMAHGYIVLIYNCDLTNAACAANVGLMQKFASSSGPTPGNAVVVTADSQIPANTFWATSWMWSYELASSLSTSIDSTVLQCYIQQHAGNGLPELEQISQ